MLKGKRLNILTYSDEKDIRPELPEFPEFPGIKQDSHHGVCVLVFLSLSWADKALFGSRYLIALRLGLTCSY